MSEQEVEIVDLTQTKRTYRFTSCEDRRRIIECSRRGDDLKEVARHLGINIKTCRAIAATDREVPMKPGSSKAKFQPDYIQYLCAVVDDNPAFSLRQMKERMEKEFPSTNISISSIDRLLDGYHYSLKKMIVQPTERNTESTKTKRAEYAAWLQQTGSSVLRLYIDETNYNIWCCRTFGRAKIAQSPIRKLPSSRGPNLNILACFSAAGILRYECHSRVTYHIFNNFLAACSQMIHEQQQPGTEAVFLFDNAPIHRRANDTTLCENHTIKYLPPYSPFFNPIEEAFSKFKQVCYLFMWWRFVIRSSKIGSLKILMPLETFLRACPYECIAISCWRRSVKVLSIASLRSTVLHTIAMFSTTLTSLWRNKICRIYIWFWLHCQVLFDLFLFPYLWREDNVHLVSPWLRLFGRRSSYIFSKKITVCNASWSFSINPKVACSIFLRVVRR